MDGEARIGDIHDHRPRGAKIGVILRIEGLVKRSKVIGDCKRRRDFQNAISKIWVRRETGGVQVCVKWSISG